MNTKKTNKIISGFLGIAILGLVSFPNSFTYSQCKGVAKKCVPNLSPYVYTGQLNSTPLQAGETAELVMAFTGGQQYRILTCGSENLGKLKFSILNSKRQVVFNNKDYNNIQYWDLKVEATDDYIVQVSVPAGTSVSGADTKETNCVAVLIGFKNDF